MEPNRISVKFFLKPGFKLDPVKVIPIFHRWIQQSAALDGLPIDVADYSHVVDGPGVLLIGHEFDYALEETDRKPGLLYTRKRSMSGSLADRFRQAIAGAAMGVKLIQSNPAPHGPLSFDGSQVELRVIDKLRLPNNDASFASVKSAIEGLIGEVFGSGAKIQRIANDPRAPLAIGVTGSNVADPASLADRLMAAAK